MWKPAFTGVGIDIKIPGNVRSAVEGHTLAPWITLIEGDSVATPVIEQVAEQVDGAGPVLVILDSNHSREHVSRELAAYADFVTAGSYLVVTDGVMQDLAGVPGADPNWVNDNPLAASREFLAGRDDFEQVERPKSFADSPLTKTPTYWPQAWLRKKW